jgi:hypothetical protein
MVHGLVLADRKGQPKAWPIDLAWPAEQPSQWPDDAEAWCGLPTCLANGLVVQWYCVAQPLASGGNVTSSFKAKTRCSSYICLGSSCHTYGQNVSIENQCLYYIVYYYKNLLQVQKGLNNGMDTILPQAVDWGFCTPRRGLHQSTPHLLSSRA